MTIAILAWIAFSIPFGLIVGRLIRFGMTGRR